MKIQPHTFLFNLQKRLETFKKDQPQSTLDFEFVPTKALFKTVGTKFTYLKLDNIISKNIISTVPSTIAVELQTLIDSIIYSSALRFGVTLNELTNRNLTDIIATTVSVDDGIALYHALFDFCGGVKIYDSNITLYIGFTVTSANELSSAYIIFQ
jgi:hypothetical protein